MNLFIAQFGSVALFGLYTIVKYFGKEWINYLLGIYFSLAGVGSVWKSLISLVRFCLGETRWKKFDKTKFLVLKGPWGVLPFWLLLLCWQTLTGNNRINVTVV